jgi:hypothetical protein
VPLRYYRPGGPVVLPWVQRVLPGEFGSRGHSIQAGRLCYNNGCAVDVGAQLDASLAPPARRLCLIGPGSTMEIFLPMGRFIKPVFIRGGCHTLKGWRATWSSGKSLPAGRVDLERGSGSLRERNLAPITNQPTARRLDFNRFSPNISRGCENNPLTTRSLR